MSKASITFRYLLLSIGGHVQKKLIVTIVFILMTKTLIFFWIINFYYKSNRNLKSSCMDEYDG